MEKFVAEIWKTSEDENGQTTGKFCGFWHGADDLESMLDKGQAFVKLMEDMGHMVEEHAVSFKKGHESVTIRVAGGMECRIIHESASKHIKDGTS